MMDHLYPSRRQKISEIQIKLNNLRGRIQQDQDKANKILESGLAFTFGFAVGFLLTIALAGVR